MNATSPLPSPVLPPGHPPVQRPRVGVLLMNLGSPSGADTASVRRYLREFLSDPRVIETWRPLWWPILNLVILNIRPAKSAHAYRQVWNSELNQSPLIVITRRQAEKLRERLAGDAMARRRCLYWLPCCPPRAPGHRSIPVSSPVCRLTGASFRRRANP